MAPLTHAEIAAKYSKKTSEKTELELLEQVEDRIARWRLNKWEFRIPPLLGADVREKLLLQQDMLKSLCLSQNQQLEAVKRDIDVVASLTGTAPETVREKNRAWLQEEASKLRWKGDVNKAKDLRDAFLRLEVYGSRDYRLLERLCTVYGLGLQGTYEDAFSNLIVEDPVTGRAKVDESNPFVELLSHIVSRFPHIDIIFDFLGFNPVTGYRPSLRRFMDEMLRKKNGVDVATPSSQRVVFHSPESKELLFDFGDSKAQVAVDDSVYGLPDFLYMNHSDFFLITVASDNHWLRSRQVPHRKQLEGIARRGAFVFGIPYESARIRNLLLPPNYMDKSSLLRLLEGVLGLSEEQQKASAPWLSLYDKELDAKDVDFCELAQTVNEEHWLTL